MFFLFLVLRRVLPKMDLASRLGDSLKSWPALFIGIATFYLIRSFRNRKLLPGPWGLPIVGYIPFLKNEYFKSLIELEDKYGSVYTLKLGLNNVVM